MINRSLAAMVGFFVLLKAPPKRDERGLSQSAESAILIGAAVTVALVVLAFIVPYVRAKLGEVGQTP